MSLSMPVDILRAAIVGLEKVNDDRQGNVPSEQNKR
jgi:hypothetical protein